MSARAVVIANLRAGTKSSPTLAYTFWMVARIGHTQRPLRRWFYEKRTEALSDGLKTSGLP